MDTASIITAIGSPAAAVAILKWALARYEVQAKQLEDTRRDKIESDIRQFRELVKQYGSKLEAFATKLAEIDKNLAISIEKFKFSSAEVDKLMIAFRAYVETNSKRVSDVESQVSEISKDVFRISTKKGKQ